MIATRQEVFEWIMAQGAVQAKVHYSGGGDEGGVESIELVDAAEKNVRSLQEWHSYDRVWNRKAAVRIHAGTDLRRTGKQGIVQTCL